MSFVSWLSNNWYWLCGVIIGLVGIIWWISSGKKKKEDCCAEGSDKMDNENDGFKEIVVGGAYMGGS